MLPKKLSDEECRDNVEKHSKDYSDSAFFEKARKFAKVIGREALYKAFQLYYVLQKPELPQKTKTIIMGALAYFILPLDLVPDALPLIGYSDDLTVIAYALWQALPYMDDEVNSKADKMVRKIFGE